MGRTLLVGASTGVWREWLKENRQGRDLLFLDPADADHGFPGRVALFQGEKCTRWSFLGSLYSQRSPHVVLHGLFVTIFHACYDAIVELSPYQQNSLRLQLARMCAEIVSAETV